MAFSARVRRLDDNFTGMKLEACCLRLFIETLKKLYTEFSSEEHGCGGEVESFS
jgi:hypothetical protein